MNTNRTEDVSKYAENNVLFARSIPIILFCHNAHPKTRLFITHGGGLSLHEAVYNGVPVVVIPFFMDQIKNSGIAVAKGFGATLNMKDLDKTNLVYTTIAKVLQDDRYRKNSRKISELYKDQPMKPNETALFWMEYVMRHGGAHHFDLPTRDMGYLEILNLDLFFFASFVLIILILTIFIILHLSIRLFKYCFISNKKPKLKTT